MDDTWQLREDMDDEWPDEDKRDDMRRIRNAWANRCVLCLFMPFHGSDEASA